MHAGADASASSLLCRRLSLSQEKLLALLVDCAGGRRRWKWRHVSTTDTDDVDDVGHSRQSAVRHSGAGSSYTPQRRAAEWNKDTWPRRPVSASRHWHSTLIGSPQPVRVWSNHGTTRCAGCTGCTWHARHARTRRAAWREGRPRTSRRHWPSWWVIIIVIYFRFATCGACHHEKVILLERVHRCSSSDENVEQHQVAAELPNPQNKPTDLGCESTCRLLSFTLTIDSNYYSARKLMLTTARPHCSQSALLAMQTAVIARPILSVNRSVRPSVPSVRLSVKFRCFDRQMKIRSCGFQHQVGQSLVLVR